MGSIGLVQSIDALTRPRSERSEIGQFLTSPRTARLLAESFSPFLPGQDIRLLDPGAGAGALSLAFVERALRSCPASLQLTVIESDRTIIPRLRETLVLAQRLADEAAVRFDFDVYEDDFVQLAGSCLERNPGLFTGPSLEPEFSHVILNPPYKKISTDGWERSMLSRVGIETSNIYAGFVALSLKLLRDNGELVAITPRSFCNGPYFKPFRELMLSDAAMLKFHVVSSRDKTFADDAVLQENVIFALRKTALRPETVQICTSERGTFEDEVCHRVPSNLVVNPGDRDKVISLPVDRCGLESMTTIASLPCTLSDLGISVSTGPVVDFRAKDLLRAEIVPGAVPLVYPGHFNAVGVGWPKNGKKPNAIFAISELKSYLVKAQTYVLVKRFSSKEERKRVVARVLLGAEMGYSSLGLENHLNYFHKNGRELDDELAFGLCAFLNWTTLDSFFRQFNGHTQVNASDLRRLRYPSGNTLFRIGERIMRASKPWEQTFVDQTVEAEI